MLPLQPNYSTLFLIFTWLQVSDIYCNCCDVYLGWKYEEAFEQSQKYKEGKAVLEKARMRREEWTTTIE